VMSRAQDYELSHWDNEAYGLLVKTSGVWSVGAFLFPPCSSINFWFYSSSSSICKSLMNTIITVTITII
jgi:hypothetical protein